MHKTLPISLLHDVKQIPEALPLDVCHWERVLFSRVALALDWDGRPCRPEAQVGQIRCTSFRVALSLATLVPASTYQAGLRVRLCFLFSGKKGRWEAPGMILCSAETPIHEARLPSWFLAANLSIEHSLVARDLEYTYTSQWAQTVVRCTVFQ